MIKRIALVAVAALAASMAQASDLPYGAQFAAPAAAPIAVATNTWTGFYIGGNLGAIGGTKNSASLTGSSDGDFSAGLVGNRVQSSSNVGVLFGPVVGYNYQISPSFVVGAEADYGWANADRRSTFHNSVDLFGNGAAMYDVNATSRSQLDSFGTLRARVGYLATPNLMLYGTAGLAFGSVKHTVHAIDTITVPEGVATFSDVTAKGTKSKVGWTAGVGAEYALNRNWSVKVEYLYANLGKSSVSFPGTGFYNYAAKNKNEFQLVRAGVNYRF
jgi:outer membrane immunogenic protein